jgi:hypothetical protein
VAAVSLASILQAASRALPKLSNYELKSGHHSRRCYTSFARTVHLYHTCRTAAVNRRNSRRAAQNQEFRLTHR